MATTAEERRAQAQIDRWNAQYPPGTPVTVRRDNGDVVTTKTRSIAWGICDHASVLVEGISGGYSLERVTPILAPEPAHV